MKPIIGITCAWSEETWGNSSDGEGYYYVGRPYAEAVTKCGGIPMMIPPSYINEDLHEMIDRILSCVNGLIFSGGGDAKRFSPAEFPTLEEQQPRRYYFESELLKEASKRNIPVLGICRGHQMIAEVFGGSISKELIDGHKQNLPGYKPWHEVSIEAKSKMSDITGIHNWRVNSFHRQVVEKVPEGFIASIKADGGTIEAIESIDHTFFIGLQFHPEELMRFDKPSELIIKCLIENAKISR
ncbi:gamma-glutamyl-gamma-aminobutyrate hydrolase family protein [Lutispora saccharofermentans]|uniref:Type 1 glutamine amidotransferase n=1 Tax=Lutispora saccharofermentans TaxID=3024236 RepID=A0ABT1NCU4_9FIRM|nr:type 1 glutamine amidotransferase [Lutispora saccharofermentans]MCQ1528956.1 type 1 glutamine amidotransferase [Lutispora saccharofermentans]